MLMDGGPGAVVKAASRKIGDRGFEPRSSIQVFKETKCFYPAHS